MSATGSSGPAGQAQPGEARRRPSLPLAVWAGLTCAGGILATVGGAAAALRWRGGMGAAAAEALATGAVVGLLLSLGAVTGAVRLAAALRSLHADAELRLREPSAPVGRSGTRQVTVRITRELAELARSLSALHLRVRVADDLGERHRIQAQTAGAGVSELLSGLVAAEEGARGQLAAELHDTVAQSLMIARSLLHATPTGPAELATLRDHVEDAEEQLRAVMARTRPPALHDGDLAAAVSGLRLDLQARYGLRVHVEWPQVAHPLPLAAAVTIYRFFQEALLNVVKHADVDDARLRLEVTGDALLASVRDEGPGFDPAAVCPERGRQVGLGLLRERARLSGGALDVRSRPGAGALLQLRLPLPPVAPAVPRQRNGTQLSERGA